MPGRVAAVLWLTWVAAMAFLTAGVFRWHLDYFYSPGPQFHRLALIFVPGLVLFAWLYAGIRRAWLWNWEPVALAILMAAACLRYEPRAAIITATLFLACCAVGGAALRALRLTLTHPIDRITTNFGAGAGILITTLFVLGLFRLSYPAVFLIILLSPLIFFWRSARENLSDLRTLLELWRTSEAARHPLAGVAVVIGFIAAVCSLMIVLAPSIAFDSVATHLPSVQYYTSHHALIPVTGIDYSYYPQGIEMLWTLAYSLAGQPGAQMLSALFFALFLMTLAGLARECGLDAGAAVIAAIFTATLPFLHWSGSVLKNDLALALFELLTLSAFVRWQKDREFRWILAGTFFLAQAFGVKYVAAFGALPLALLFGYAVWRQPRRWQSAALVLAVFLAFGTYWTTRAYLLTGNPVAPAKLTAAVSATNQIHDRSFAGRTLRYLQLPWQLTFHGREAFESPLDSPAGILLFAFAPLALLTGRLRPATSAQIACLVFAAVYLIYWSSILSKTRYAIAPFALVALLVAAWMKTFYDSQHGGLGQAVKVSLIGVETYCLLIATMGLMIVGINAPQLSYFAGRLDKPGYLRAAMQTYGAVEFLNHTGSGTTRVFSVGNFARAYAPGLGQFQGMLCSDRSPCPAADVVARTKQSNADYLILPENGKVPPEVLETLDHPERVYRDAYFSVYHLSK